MDRNIKKILLFLVVLFTVITLSINVNAVTIHETTNTNDGYDTIDVGTIIIGKTKFTPDTIITAYRAATAGANDMRIYIAQGNDVAKYTNPVIYVYAATNDWYAVKEDGSTESIKPVSELDIYYVNNNPKTGIDSKTNETITIPTIEDEPETYSFTLMNGSSVYGEVQTIEKGKTATKPETNPTLDGYVFRGWYKDNKEFDFSTAITTDTVVVAEYAKTYLLATHVDDGGKVTVNANNMTKTDAGYLIPVGEEVSFTYTLDEGYKIYDDYSYIVDSKGNNIEATTPDEGKTFVIVMPESDVDVFATFVRVASKIDKENDEVLTAKLDEAIKVLDDNNDQNVLDVSYDTTTNTLEIELNSNTANDVNLVDYAKSNLKLISKIATAYDELTEDLIKVTYKVGNKEYEMYVTGNDNNQLKVEIATLLLRATGKEVPTDENAIKAAAKALVLADAAGKEVSAVAEYATGEKVEYKLKLVNVVPESKQDEENDAAITSAVDEYMDQVTEEDSIMEITYNTENNEATIVVDEADTTTLVTAYSETFSDLEESMLKDAQEMTYVVGGKEYKVDLTNMDKDSIEKEVAKLLLRELGKSVTTEEAAKLKLADLVDKTFTVSAKYDYGVIINYTIKVDSAKSVKDIDEENDAAINTDVTTYNGSAKQTDAIPAVKYDEEERIVTVTVNEAKGEDKVVEHADDFLPFVNDIVKDAEKVTYTVNGVEYEVEANKLTGSTAKEEIAKIILNVLGEEYTKSRALGLSLEELINNEVELVVDYGCSRKIDYTLSFDSINYTEIKDNEQDEKIDAVIDNYPQYNDLISYNSEDNKVTFTVSETRMNSTILSTSDALYDLVDEMKDGAKKITYTEGGVEKTLDLTSMSDSDVAKAIVKYLIGGLPVGVEKYSQLKYSHLVGHSGTINVDYGNGVVVPYSMDFIEQ